MNAHTEAFLTKNKNDDVLVEHKPTMSRVLVVDHSSSPFSHAWVESSVLRKNLESFSVSETFWKLPSEFLDETGRDA